MSIRIALRFVTGFVVLCWFLFLLTCREIYSVPRSAWHYAGGDRTIAYKKTRVNFPAFKPPAKPTQRVK